ncbi:MAG: hypothetical protein R2875_16795 [Desulfobacterales bacterium]
MWTPVSYILTDPYLSGLSLIAFPRLKQFHEDYFSIKRKFAERAAILTQWFRENGFEKDAQGNDWVPEIRQGQAFKYLMTHKKPIMGK